jgi:thymidine kinase
MIQSTGGSMQQEHEIEILSNHSHLEIICGPMFSGKTEELIRRIRRVEYARMRAIVFKPVIDNRYSNDLVVSHSEQKIDSVPVADVSSIRAYLGKTTKPFHVIGLDEVHFFNHEIIDLCQDLVSLGIRVIGAGLAEDYLAKPFGPMPLLLTHADIVTKLWAVCMRCGAPASKTQRLSRTKDLVGCEQVLVGASLYYEARCRSCFKGEIVTLSEEEQRADVALVEARV